MEYGIAQSDIRTPGARHPEVRSLGVTMAAAASRSIGRKVGASLALHGQQLIKNLRQPKA